jgi:hypothetical protein
MSEIAFDIIDDGKPKPVKYDGNMTIENFIKDYLKNNANYQSLDSKVFSFMLGAKLLNADRFLSKKVKELIQNGSSVTLVRKYEYNYSKISIK